MCNYNKNQCLANQDRAYLSIFNTQHYCANEKNVSFFYDFLLILNTSCPVEYIVSDMLGTEKCYRKWDTIKNLVGLLQRARALHINLQRVYQVITS